MTDSELRHVAKTILMTSPIELTKELPKGDQTIFRLAQQWSNLRNACASAGADVVVVPVDLDARGEQNFVSKAGLMIRGKLLASVSKNDSTVGQHSFVKAWLKSRGITVNDHSESIDRDKYRFDGAADALYDSKLNILWYGIGFHSSAEFQDTIDEFIPGKFIEVIHLKLVDPLYQNLDTCFCPLQNGWLLWYPDAFAEDCQEFVRITYRGRTIDVDSHEAFQTLACSALPVGDFVITPTINERIANALIECGMTPIQVDTSLIANKGGLKRLMLDVIE